jgi:hypothetical protein
MATAHAAEERRWFILERWQEFEGEGRTNLLRVVALAGYYAVHLGTVEKSASLVSFHQQATMLTAGWLFLSLAVLVCLQRRYLPTGLKYVTTLVDLLLVTSLAALGSGPASPLVVVYFLIIVSAALRFSLGLIWMATLTALVCYLALVGLADKTWFDANHTTPVVTQLTMLLSLGMTGIILGQIMRRVRRMMKSM